MTRTVAVVTAGMGVPSATAKLGERLGAAVAAALDARGETAQVVRVEVRDVAHEAVNAALTHVAAPALQEALDAVARADAVVAVTPVWNGSYAGLFKLFFDVLDPDALVGTPVLLAATGGTARHSLAIDQAMLPLFWGLKAQVMPTAVFAATEEWGQASGLTARIERAAGELADAVRGPAGDGTATAAGALHQPAASRARRSDPFDDVPDFATLLASVRPGG